MTTIEIMFENARDTDGRIYTLRHVAEKLGATLNSDMTDVQLVDAIGGVEDVSVVYEEDEDLDVQITITADDASTKFRNIVAEFSSGDIEGCLENQDAIVVYFQPKTNIMGLHGDIDEGDAATPETIAIFNGAGYRNYQLVNNGGTFTASEMAQSDGQAAITMIVEELDVVDCVSLDTLQQAVNAYIEKIHEVYIDHAMPADINSAITALPGLLSTYASYGEDDEEEMLATMELIDTHLTTLTSHQDQFCDIAGSDVDALDTAYQSLMEIVGAADVDELFDAGAGGATALGALADNDSDGEF